MGASERTTSLIEKVLAQPHAVEHVIGDGFGQPARVVAGAQNRIEADRVEVHNFIGMPGLSQAASKRSRTA